MTVKISEWIPGTVDMYAWVDTDGMIHDVGDAYKHIDFFKNHPVFGEDYLKLQSDLERVDQEIEDDLAELEPDEHPAMHRFAYAHAEPRDEFYLKIYEAGWCRLGYHTWTYGKKRKFAIELYGVESALNNHKKILLELKLYLAATVRLGIISRHTTWCRGSNYEMKLKKL